MLKAFISHSSLQKEFALNLVEELGRDYCKIDCYNLGTAYKSINEIYKAIDTSTVFVLLISKESLSSDWVNNEIRHAKKKLSATDYDRFWPYIIETLTFEDCPEWMRDEECFNMKQFSSVKVLARDIEQKFRKIIWAKDSRRMQLDNLMVGRNDDIAKFEDKFQSLRGINLKALIVSGRNGVGKDTFAMQCMKKVGYAPEIVPYRISTNPHENIENFINYLNLIINRYDDKQINEVFAQPPKEKAHIAVQLLNQLYDTGTVVFITDNMSCIMPNRELSEWMIDILTDSTLNNQLGLFLLSNRVPNSFIETELPAVAHIQLKPLDKKDREKLFISYIRAYNIQGVIQEDVNFFVDRLLQSPSQIIQAVKALYTGEKAIVKRDIDSFVHQGDKRVQPILDHFGDEEQRYLLIIMSRIDYVSYQVLEDIFGERIIETMDTLYEMMEYGIVTAFGPSEQFFRLDHYVSDYIRRCKFSLPKDWELSVNEVFEKRIAKSNSITEDSSLYLYDVKRKIMSGKGDSAALLMPSIVLTSVMEVYDDKNYTLVREICYSVLNGTHTYYQEMVRELRYWLCIAQCRLQDDRFFDEVKELSGADHYFLRGFYARNAKEFASAEKYYNQALTIAPKLKRAKREKVTVLLAQNKFDKALHLAKENYEGDPENSYQIYGYFRCLVKKKGLERVDMQQLDELMDAMKNNYSNKHQELYTSMNIEYQAYVMHLSPIQMFSIIADAEKEFPNSVNIERASYNYKLRQSLVTKEKIFDEDYY